MMAWHRSEPFCAYVQRRRAQRVAWLAECYAHATTEHSRRLADRLALAWRLPPMGSMLGEIASHKPNLSEAKGKGGIPVSVRQRRMGDTLLSEAR